MDHIKLEPCTKVGRARKKGRRMKSLACILSWTFYGREQERRSLRRCGDVLVWHCVSIMRRQ